MEHTRCTDLPIVSGGISFDSHVIVKVILFRVNGAILMKFCTEGLVNFLPVFQEIFMLAN